MGAQTGCQSFFPLSNHIHSSSDGGQLNPEVALNPKPRVLFGDGADGAGVIAADTDLTRDMSYESLTINAGFTLNTKGFKVRVRGKLTIAATGALAAKGGDGENGAEDTAGPTAGGIRGNDPSSRRNIIGIFGGNGGSAAAAGTANGAGGNPAAASLNYTGTIIEDLIGGSGGGGGGGHGTTPDAGLGPTAPLWGPIGGGGGTATGSGSYWLQGGAGGGPGGFLELWAYEIDNAGTITAAGGKGGNGLTRGGSTKSGNGGGGAGGTVRVYYRTTSGSGLGTRSAAGGAAGTGGNLGSAGNAGISESYQI